MSYQIPTDPQITSMVLYYRALNMARKEPSLVAAYVKRVEKGAPIVKVLKPDLGMPWERHGYSIELRREIDAEHVVLIPSDAAGFYTVEMYRYMYRTAVPCRTCGYLVSVPVLAKG